MSPKVFRLILCDTFGSYLFLIKIVPYHWILISFLEFTVSSVIYIIIYKIDLTSLFAEKIAETSRFQNRIHSLQCMNYKALWFQQLFHPPCLIFLLHWPKYSNQVCFKNFLFIQFIIWILMYIILLFQGNLSVTWSQNVKTLRNVNIRFETATALIFSLSPS